MSKRPSLAETMRLATAGPEPVSNPPPLALKTAEAVPASRETGFYAATRVGKKKVTATLLPAEHKRLRQLALERDVTTEALLNEAISDLFAKYGKTPAGQGTSVS
jgi:antitoxin-like ribbon-helix-helix protein